MSYVIEAHPGCWAVEAYTAQTVMPVATLDSPERRGKRKKKTPKTPQKNPLRKEKRKQREPTKKISDTSAKFIETSLYGYFRGSKSSGARRCMRSIRASATRLYRRLPLTTSGRCSHSTAPALVDELLARGSQPGHRLIGTFFAWRSYEGDPLAR